MPLFYGKVDDGCSIIDKSDIMSSDWVDDLSRCMDSNHSNLIIYYIYKQSKEGDLYEETI